MNNENNRWLVGPYNAEGADNASDVLLLTAATTIES